MKKVKKRNLIGKGNLNITSILLIVVSVYFVTTFVKQQISINRYNSQIEMYKQDIANKEALTKHYSEKQENVETDEYIEQIARENLGLVKPYEKIFVDINK